MKFRKNGTNLNGIFLRFVMIFMAMTACRSNHEDSSQSLLHHDLDHPTNDAEPWHWRNITDEEYFQYVTPMTGDGSLESHRENFLASDHAVTMRLDQWITRIDDFLRIKYPKQLTNIPKPKLKLLKNDVPNAYVSPVPICVSGVQVEFPNSRGDNSAELASWAQNSFYSLDDWTKGNNDLPCVQQTPEQANLKERVEWHNRNYSKCKIDLREPSDLTDLWVLKPNSSCEFDIALRGTSKANGLVVLSTQNHITVNTGLVSSMSEDEVVFVIAHELGHYYHSHGTTSIERYGFPYQLTILNGNYRPSIGGNFPTYSKLERSQNEIQHLYGEIDALKKSYPEGLYSPIRGQVYHTALLSSVRLSVELARTFQCGENVITCDNACHKASMLLSGELGEAFNSTHDFKGTIRPETQSSYLAIQNDITACLGTAILGVNEEFSTRFLTWQITRYDMNLEHYIPTDFSKIRSLHEFYTIITENLALNYPKFDPLAAGKAMAIDVQIKEVEKKIQIAEDENRALSIQANDLRIGVYTAEQEADESALEWLHGIGIDPHSGIHAFLAFSRSRKDLSSVGASIDQHESTPVPNSNGDRDVSTLTSNLSNLNASQCEEIYRRGWKDDTGNSIIIPVGSYDDPHHQDCYRAFNVDLEINAHNLLMPAVIAETLAVDQWKLIQDSLHFSTSTNEKNQTHAERKFFEISCLFHRTPYRIP